MRKKALTLEQKEAMLRAADTPAVSKHKKKEFYTVFTNGMSIIKLTGGGEVPAKLKGQYTSATLAERAIDDYLRERDASTEGA